MWEATELMTAFEEVEALSLSSHLIMKPYNLKVIALIVFNQIVNDPKI